MQAIEHIHTSLTRSCDPGVTRDHVICGQAGIGKTSLAIVYAWHHLNDFPGGLSLVDCTAEDFCTSVSELFHYLFDISDSELPHVAKNALRVKLHFENSDKPALLILDNVRNVEHWKQLLSSPFLPGGACSRLITTTATDLPRARLSLLEPLSRDEGVKLLATFRDDIASDQNRRTAEYIVDWLGGVPFYICVVGIYMRRHRSVTWHGYAQCLDELGLDAVRGTEKAAGMLADNYDRRVDQVMNSLLDSLSEHERRALEYVALCQRTLTIYFFRRLINEDPSLTTTVKPGYETVADAVIETLENERLLTRHGEADDLSFSVHEILNRKLVEVLNANTGHKRRLLKNVEMMLVRSSSDTERFTSLSQENPLLALAPCSLYQHRTCVVQVARTARSSSEWRRHHQFWIDIDNDMPTLKTKMRVAQALAVELGGEVALRPENAAGRVTMSPYVFVKERDLSRAQSLAQQHGGKVTRTTEREYRVIIKIAG